MSSFLVASLNELGISFNQIVMFVGDSVDLNIATLKSRIIRALFPNALSSECMVHTLTHCPETAIKECPILKEFWTHLMELLRFSTKVEDSYRQAVGIPSPSYSRTRLLDCMMR
jgi:hypothetical protein